jgi:hypothetical protein|tara:strand:+ start:1263 stop:1445 length:183 start_codon:yes stop_codon:yes gene_type:complete
LPWKSQAREPYYQLLGVRVAVLYFPKAGFSAKQKGFDWTFYCHSLQPHMIFMQKVGFFIG